MSSQDDGKGGEDKAMDHVEADTTPLGTVGDEIETHTSVKSRVPTTTASMDNNPLETVPDDKDNEKAKATDTPYQSRKPLWWKKLGQGKPTKGQKKAIQAMQSTHQLSRLAYGEYYDWKNVFGDKTRAACLPWVEIGCGTGENLLALAEKNPEKYLIGAEMHSSGIGNCFQRIYQSTQRSRYWKDYTPYSLEREQECRNLQGFSDEKEELHVSYNDESLYSSDPTAPEGPYPHVRIFTGNGVKVLQASPSGSLDTVLITFPDPFPKNPSHRLLQFEVLNEIARALRPQGGRLGVASDHDGHAAWAKEQVENHQQHTGSSWKKIPTTTELRALYLPVVSKYEAKGWREGRTTKVLIYERTAESHEENTV